MTQLEDEPETSLSAIPTPASKPGLFHHVRKFIERTDPTAHPRHRGLRIVRYVRRLSDAYATHQCSLLACSCAYCAILSLVPLLIVGVAILGFFLKGGRAEALTDTIHAIQAYVPVKFDFLRGQLETVLATRKVVGIFGLTFLIYGAHQTFLAMQPAMNIIWVVPETRHWFRQRLVALGATFFTLILLSADLAASWLVVHVAALAGHWLNNAYFATLLKGATGLLPVLITTLLFAVLYQILPDRHVPWKSAFMGAGVAALFWQLTKFGFGFYLLHSQGYNLLYGQLSSIVVLVVWMYYSMALLLLGAEVAADYEFMRHGRKAAEARAHSGADLTSAAHDASAPRPTLPANPVGMVEMRVEEGEREQSGEKETT